MIDLEAEIRRIVRDELTRSPASRHVTVAEYARARSISESTVRAAIREGRLPKIRIGRAVRVPADVEIQEAKVERATERARMTLLGGGKVR